LQQQIRQRVGAASEGLRATVEQLRQTFRTNPLPDAAAERARADALAAELERLAKEELEPIESLLATARTERALTAPADRRTGPLREATRLQADAERTLRDLGERMETWSEARELRAQAALIERDQERVARQRAQLEAEPGVRGAARNVLTAPQQEALARLTERQSAVADQANELVQKLNQRAGEKRAAQAAKEAESQKLEAESEGGDSKEARRARAEAGEARNAANDLAKQAQALAKARDVAEGSPSLAAQIQGALRSLEQNKLGDAQAAQESVTQTLRRVQDALAEIPERDVDRLSKRLKEAEQAVNDLADEQERLQKRATEASALSVPLERQDALKKLAREQEQLRERADDLAQRLSRMRQEGAAQNLRRATRAMDQAHEQIEQGQPSEGKQDEALDRLDDAQNEIEQARKSLEDELQRERRAKFVDALNGFVARQTALATESERVFQAARTEKSWPRALQKSLIEMGQAEIALAGELDRFTESSVKDAKVVVHLLRETSGAMNQVGPAVESIRNGPMDMDSWEVDRSTVQSPQQLAARRLKQLSDTIQEANKEEVEQASKPQQGSPAGNGGGNSSDGISANVQLKLLRSMQAELNVRTATFANGHQDSEKWTPADRAEIKALQRSQAELAELLESLTPAEPPPPDQKEEKK
jgi:hypothetical protein